MLAKFLQFLFFGITVEATCALTALGVTLTYNASNVINFSQGEFIMFGGLLVALALAVADRGYLLETGTVTLSGTGQELISNEQVRAAYLGM